MKRLLSLFAIVPAILAGCTKISTEGPREALQPMTFSASVFDEPEAKAEIEGLAIKWSTGDEIGIFDGTAFRRFTLKEGAGTTSGVFEGEAAKADAYIGVYPYNENLSLDSEGRINGLSVPSIQTAGACPVIMTAECEDGGNAFIFKSALAYVKVTPEFDCHKIVFEAHDKSNLCGNVRLAPDIYDSVPHASVVGNSKGHALLTGDIKSGESYCLAVAPIVLLEGFTIVFDALTDNLQYSVSRDRNKDGSFVNFERGHVLNFGKFTRELSKWTERNEYLALYGTERYAEDEHFDYRAVYDWKDVTRIAAQSQKIGNKKQQQIHFMEDIDFGGRTLNTMTLDNDGFVNIEGHGYKIFNYKQGSVDDGNYRYAGLFYMKKLWGITFDSLTLCPNEFDLSHDNDIYGGAFVAKGYFTDRICFEKCHVQGNIKVSCTGTTSEACVGGFCGMVECGGTEKEKLVDTQKSVSVSNCLMEGTVTADSEHDMAYAGGFIGLIEAPSKYFIGGISRSRNTATIIARGDDDFSPLSFNQGGISAGGMLGCDRDISTGGDIALTVNSCVNEGAVTAHAKDKDNAFAGGMIGCHDSDGLDYEESQFQETVELRPAVCNCLNRGGITVKGGNGWFGTTAGLAGGMVGYCYDDKTGFSNCVDDGTLVSDDICAHISGAYGSYDSDSDYPCYWTNSDSHFGIHKHGDKGEYKQGGKSGHKADLKAGGMKGDFYRDYASWIMKDGHLDLDI